VTLRLEVAPGWRPAVDAVAAAFAAAGPLVPVVKGNGYGFGRTTLAPIAAELASTIAVGTVFELDAAQPGTTTLVLTPITPGQHRRLPTDDVIVTVGSFADVAALGGWRGPAVVKLVSSMRRFGATPGEVAAVLAAAERAGLEIVGAALHLPLAGDDTARRAEVDTWLGLLGEPGPIAPALWVSHLGPGSLADLAAGHPGWRFPARVGTALWHGDKSNLHLGADVLVTRQVAAGEPAGYHATPAPADGWVIVVGAGSTHGVAPLDDGRSPFHFERRRIALLERPHMHTTTLFAPATTNCPSVGDAVDVQRPLTAVTVDELVWSDR
jgi:alanine racemase